MLEEHNEDPALIQMRLLDDGGEELTLVLILYVSTVNIGPFLGVEHKTIISSIIYPNCSCRYIYLIVCVGIF